MSVPNYSPQASAFLGPRLARLSSLEATRRHSFEAVRAFVVELHKSDPRAGLLAKTTGDEVDGFAADILLYDLGDDTAQVVDIVSNAEGADNPDGSPGYPAPSWSLKDIRPISQWRAPGSSSDGGNTGEGSGGKYGDFAAAARGLEGVVKDLASLVAQLSGAVKAQSAEIAELKARPVGGDVTGLVDGATIALKAHSNGQYVTGELNGEINAKLERKDDGTYGPRPFGEYQLFTIELQK